MTPRRKAAHTAALLARAKGEDTGAMEHCAIFGCGRTPQARSGNGLSLTHCRYHIQFKNRHGSFWKGTYCATELRPYRRAAESFINAHASDFVIADALSKLGLLLTHAGPNERVVDVIHSKSPERKARAALARMRTKKVPPERLLAIDLAVSACVHEDPIRGGGDEYRLVQIAKAAHRQASGYHAVYGPGSRYDRYPRSSGRALRVLGEMIDQCCDVAATHHLSAILKVKVARYGERKQAVHVGKI